MAISIRTAILEDVAAMTKLVAEKRAMLETYEPVMWRVADSADQMTFAFFSHQVPEPNVIVLVAEEGRRILGFVNGVLQDAPPVYDPGGKAVMVDDFVVVAGEEGDAAALALLDALMSEGRSRGAVQMIVISAAKDARAAKWFEAKKLHVASLWWTRVLSH